MVTLTELNNTEDTSYFQKHLKFEGMDLCLTSDFSFNSTRRRSGVFIVNFEQISH